MLNATLTQSELDRISSLEREDPTIQFLLNRPENYNFKIGDILVLWRLKDGAKDSMVVLSHRTSLPKKWIYVHENKLGIGYVKAINADGETSTHVSSILNFNINYYRFDLDPEYADHILLSNGDPYDPYAVYKERKKELKKILHENTKLSIKLSDIDDRINFINSLNVGDLFHMGVTVTIASERVYEVVSVSYKPTYPGLYTPLREKFSKLAILGLCTKWKIVEVKNLSTNVTTYFDAEKLRPYVSLQTLRKLRE